MYGIIKGFNVVPYQKIEKFFKSSWYWRVPIVAGVLTLIFMISVINQNIFLVLNSVLYIPVEFIWFNISVFGEVEIIAILLLPLIGRRPDIIWAALISCSITIISVELAKQYFALPRPSVILDFDQYHQIGQYYAVDSFPSVNVAVAFSIAAIVTLSVKQDWIKIAVLFYACLIGLAQIAIGANWPIDIFSGVIAGWLPATVGIKISRKKILKTKKAKKYLLVLFITIAIYLIYNLVVGDIDVAIIKSLILISCFASVLPELKKIIKSKSRVNSIKRIVNKN